MQWKAALVYLNDVVVYGRTFEEELQYLLFQQEMPFLGHFVGEDGVRTDPMKVTA